MRTGMGSLMIPFVMTTNEIRVNKEPFICTEQGFVTYLSLCTWSKLRLHWSQANGLGDDPGNGASDLGEGEAV